MRITMTPIDKVVPYPNNPRINDSAVAEVKASLREFGWQQPIVVDQDGVIIVGHTRRLAAIDLGMTMVPVHVAADLTPAQIKAYRIADNKTGEFATWDDALLGAEFGELAALNYDSTLTGFADMEIADFMGPEQDDPDDGEALTPGELLALTNVTIAEGPHAVEKGDVWRVGPHILLVCSPLTDWALWRPHLDDPACIFCPFPGPMVPLGVKAKEHKLIMVQPDTYIANHLLRQYADAEGADSVVKV